MSIAPPPRGLPPAYDGCSCICHRQPGVKHFMACCGPGRSRLRDQDPEEPPQ